jgi:hypothetical protein
VSYPFGKEAPDYWKRGLPALPVEPGTKQPAKGLINWPSYCSNLPKPETQAQWLRTCAHCGLALGLGAEVVPGYRIAAIDEDVGIYVRPIIAILGGDVSSKVGKKGRTFFVLVPITEKIKSTKIFDAQKRGAVDFLFNGRMTLIPPTIHPETKQPYRWTSSSLLEVDLSTLPIFTGEKLRLLRLVVASENALALTSGQATHEPGVRLAAELVAAGCEDDLIREIFVGLLPKDYAGNSLDELTEWIESARRKGFGEKAGAQREKKSAADKLLELYDQSGAALFHDEGSRGYMTVTVAHGRRTYPIRSSDASLWLSKRYYDTNHKAIADRSMEEVVRLLEAKARFEGPQLAVNLRVGGDVSSEISIDLGREDGLLVALKPGSWSIGHETAIKLVRSPGFGELPLPAASGELNKLKHLLGLDEQNWALVLAFMLLCLRPNGPYMLLLVEGEQGTGKSFLCKIIKLIIDPNQVEKARLPETQRDLMIHAKDYFLLVFDNVSGMRGDLSDALCVLATGGGFATRRLYTDDELFVFNFCRPVVINGIADFVNRPDLLERSIPLRLSSIGEGTRKTEQEMLDEFRQILPGILAGLYGIVASALANPASTRAAVTLRMADCERWLAACEPFTGLAKGSFVSTIKASQDEVFVDRAHNDPVVGEIIKLLEKGFFKGTVSELYFRIAPLEWSDRRHFPPTPSHLSRHLARQRPAMAKMGIFMEAGPHTRNGRVIHIWKDGEKDKLAPEPKRGPEY